MTMSSWSTTVAQAILVTNHFDDGLKLIEQLARDKFDVTAAFWLRMPEDDRWHLYIASKTLDDLGIHAAYGLVQSAFRQLPDLWVELFQVRLISAIDPMAKEVVDIRDRFPKQIPTHFQGARLGGKTIDDAYIYPRLAHP